MVTLARFRNLVQTFPDTSEEPHFEKISFRVKRKIFATYDAAGRLACLKLTKSDQDLFSLSNPKCIYPVKNKWGTQGWTMVNLEGVPVKLFYEALKVAYCSVAPKGLSRTVISPNGKSTDRTDKK